MTYALVIDNAIQSIGALPRAARRLDDGAWVLGLRDYGTVETQQACGYFAVVDAAKPADTATTTHDRTVELLEGVPTVVWTERNKTPDELAAETATMNRTTIEQQAATALTDNATFLALGTPTQAQVLAQVRALTRQTNGLIRLVLGQLDAVD
jgi:hypothetical protein